MPTPKAGESRNDFVGRCMMQKHPEKQRIAICESLYDQHQYEDGGAAFAGPTNAYPQDIVGKKKKYESFGDETITVPHQPIFDSHDGSEYGVELTFDAALLGQIAANTNKRIIDTDSPLPLYLGHVECRDEAHQVELLQRFEAEGLTCKALLS